MTIKRRKKSKKSGLGTIGVPVVEPSEFERWAGKVRENPLLYGAGAGFVILCFIAGVIFRVNAREAELRVMTQYAKAMETEDPAQRTAELERVSQQSTRWTDEALYMLAESAVRAQDYAKAEEAFKRVRAEFPDSEYAPRAVAGLAYLAENRGDWNAALPAYQEVIEKWPNTFIARCQPLNVGRVQEAMGDLAAAVESYQNQTELFPDSNVAAQAQAALDRLRLSHPELFPAAPPAPAPEASAETAAETIPAAPAPEVSAEAAGEAASAPVSEAPAEETPAAAPGDTPEAPKEEIPAVAPGDTPEVNAEDGKTPPSDIGES